MSRSPISRRAVPAAVAVLLAALALLAAAGSPAHASSTQVLRISAAMNGKLAFSSTKLHARPGRVEIVLTNPSDSGITHGIAISGNGVHVSSKLAAPGHSTSVTATLKKGTYTFYCPVPGHEQAGMKGTLTVS